MQLVLIDSSSSSGRQSVTPSRVMNRSQLLPALIALLAITSLSVASTTLETSLTTDPDEEINPNWESLPIGQDDAAAIQESIEGGGGESDGGGGSGSTDATGSATDDRSLFDRLIALLSRLFRLLLPIAAVLAVAALAYRYRDLLADLFGGATPERPLPPSRDRRLNAGPERPPNTTWTGPGWS